MESEGTLAVDSAERELSRILALSQAEREAALERVCAERPELAATLRERWRALQRLGLTGVAPALTAEGFPESLGDFDLLERLGAGGMGVVYRARQRSLGREVALKVLRPEALFFERSRERFRREAKAIAGLRHPSIVPVHSAGETQGVPWFAMERIEGATLAEILARLRGRAPRSLSGADLEAALGAPQTQPRPALFELSWGDACAEIARQVAEALEHAHGRGILHRDVKPSNVALARDGRAQLFDFGLALSIEGERLTQSGGTLGTLHYMSPEQVRGEAEPDARSDVYALGVTLFELLALEAPYAAETRTQLQARILSGRHAPLRELNPRVGGELALVCARAMELEPARRYASARELADDLAAVLRRRPIRARAPTTAYRAQRWLRRNPALAAAGVAAFGLFGVAPSVLLWRERAHAAEISQANDELSRVLESERAALAEARVGNRFLEDLFLGASPYQGGNPDARLRDALARGAKLLPELDAEPPMEARLALGLAAAMAGNGMYDDALPLAKHAYDLERAHDLRLEGVANRPVEVLARCLTMLDRQAEAEPLLRDALSRTVEPERRARLRFSLAMILEHLDRHEEAVGELLAVREHYLDGAAGSREPRMAIAYKLSAHYYRQGRQQEALQSAEEGLELAVQLFPAGHPAAAEGLSRSGSALAALGDCTQGLERHRQAVAIIKAYYDPDHIGYLRYHEDLATMLAACGDPGAAAEISLEVVDLLTAKHGVDHPATREAEATAERYAELARR